LALLSILFCVSGAQAQSSSVPYQGRLTDGGTPAGLYLYPEVFNQLDERSIPWSQHPEMMMQMKQREEFERARPTKTAMKNESMTISTSKAGPK